MIKLSGSRGAAALVLRLAGPALVVVLAVGCGGERPPAVRPSTSSPSVVATPIASAASSAAPLISPAERKKFLAALKAIDRDLTADREVALRRAVEVCYQVYDGKADDAVRAYARHAYSTGTLEVSAAQADTIVAKIKRWICSDGGVRRRWES